MAQTKGGQGKVGEAGDTGTGGLSGGGVASLMGGRPGWLYGVLCHSLKQLPLAVRWRHVVQAGNCTGVQWIENVSVGDVSHESYVLGIGVSDALMGWILQGHLDEWLEGVRTYIGGRTIGEVAALVVSDGDGAGADVGWGAERKVEQRAGAGLSWWLAVRRAVRGVEGSGGSGEAGGSPLASEVGSTLPVDGVLSGEGEGEPRGLPLVRDGLESVEGSADHEGAIPQRIDSVDEGAALTGGVASHVVAEGERRGRSRRVRK